MPLVTRVREVDETKRSNEPADDYLERVAGAKLAASLSDTGDLGESVVLAADTVVVADGEILGKPVDDDDARSMIRRLAGRSHQVKTRFALGAPSSGVLAARTVTTQVTFRALDAVAIDAYVATGEGRDKAGAYAIQGIGSFAVRGIEGSYSNVVGLPVCEVLECFEELGLGRFPGAPGAEE